MNPMPCTRIWRVRRRGQWIDATLQQSGSAWHLRFTRKGRALAEWEFATREQALNAARERLLELQRAAWTEHW